MATTILIIDDDDSIRAGLSTVLGLEEFETLEAPHGYCGLKLLERHAVDVLVTDIFMPHKAGFETIREAKQRWPNLKVIAMSGDGETNTRFDHARALSPGAVEALGPDRLLKKPFRPAALIKTIEEVLAER